MLAVGDAICQSWEQLVPATAVAPTPRYNPSGVYDEAGNNLVVFGGRNSSGNLDEVWSFNFDSLVWANITPVDTPAPAKRFAHNAVYDSTSRRMFIWSGQGIGFYNDVWAFDLSAHTWHNMSPGSVLPTPRYGSASAYDPTTRRLVMFSGFTDAGRYDDTQAYDVISNSWIDLTPVGTNPDSRCLHTASYDAGRHRLIIYGGQRSGPLDDIWAFDLSTNTWADLTPAIRPVGRIFPSSVYVTDHLLVFGGSTNAGSVDELWVFNFLDSTWSPVTTAGGGPVRRNAHVAIYRRTFQDMIIFGGRGDSVYNDVWRFSLLPDGVEYSESPPPGFALEQNYPNPFNSTTTIRYDLPTNAKVRLILYNTLGQNVAILIDGIQEAGFRSMTWDATGVASGVYFYRLDAASSVDPNTSLSVMKKLILMR